MGRSKKRTVTSDGFTIVTRPSRMRNTDKIAFSDDSEISGGISPNFSTKFKTILYEVTSSDFFTEFKESFLAVFEPWDSQGSNQRQSNSSKLPSERLHIICYGLGKFTSCPLSLHQLGFLIALKNLLNPVIVSIYDPVFSSEEIKQLKDLGLHVMDVNENCKRLVANNTLFFMPHCDFGLYNNLLWANWNVNSLSKMLIIGNSFRNFELYCPDRLSVSYLKYVCGANRFASEVMLVNSFKHDDIFNDLSIHYFEFSNLIAVSSEIWSENEEPSTAPALQAT